MSEAIAEGRPKLQASGVSCSPEATQPMPDRWQHSHAPVFRWCRFAKLGLERILEVLARGDAELQAPSLALLQAILTVPNLRLGALPTLTHRSGFFAPLAALLQGPQSRQALQVCFTTSVGSWGTAVTSDIVPSLRLGDLPTLTYRFGFFAPLAALLQGPHLRQALTVFSAVCAGGQHAPQAAMRSFSIAGCTMSSSSR